MFKRISQMFDDLIKDEDELWPGEAERELEQYKKNNPLDFQIGGSHYKDCAIQPIEYIEANDLGFLEGSIVKRVTRHNHATGKGKQDIEKAIHELQLIKQFRYGD